MEKFKIFRSQIDYGIFLPVQYGAIAALTGPDDFVEEQRKKYEARNRALVRRTPEDRMERQRQRRTMFVWAKIPRGHESLLISAWS